MLIHVVKENETIASIAEQYGVSPSRLIYDNQIENPDELAIGQALLVLIPDVVHQVAAGESISSIAEDYEVTELSILRNNPFLIQRGFLIEGEYIVISYEGDNEKLGDLQVYGYAYPFIDKELLEETLPYLTSLYIFSYGFTPEGELIPVDDSQLIEMALDYNVRPILVLTPLTREGTFDSDMVSLIVNDTDLQNKVINNLLRTMRAKGYSGADVDFEFIKAQDRDAYSTFINRLTKALNAEGYTLSVALAPKTSAEQEGVVYEGIDYGALGSAANSVLLMTYEWGYTFGPPMAVAPINKVREVLDYAITEIPSEKIDMGIPNYGYDWALPFIRGESMADSISNVEAVQIAIENNAPIQYDEEAASPFIEYDRDGVSHIVWFEDVRSIKEKLELVNEYGFRGVGYWQLMNPFRANWLLLNSMYNVENSK